MAALAVFLAPLAEEVFFRGLLYPTIKQLGFPKIALWTTSLLFAGMHFNLPSFVPLTAFSLLLIWLYEKTNSLWACITAHSVFNFSNFALALMTAARTAHPVK
jgi:membrane protease YdiL (CAAX protease family)